MTDDGYTVKYWNREDLVGLYALHLFVMFLLVGCSVYLTYRDAPLDLLAALPLAGTFLVAVSYEFSRIDGGLFSGFRVRNFYYLSAGSACVRAERAFHRPRSDGWGAVFERMIRRLSDDVTVDGERTIRRIK